MPFTYSVTSGTQASGDCELGRSLTSCVLVHSPGWGRGSAGTPDAWRQALRWERSWVPGARDPRGAVSGARAGACSVGVESSWVRSLTSILF